MAKRTRIEIEEIVEPEALERAFWRAARGKRARFEVRRFAANLMPNLFRLRSEALSGEIELGAGRSFYVHDPKKRLIHAPTFGERVLHHALIEKVGPALEGLLIEDTFACRLKKGALAAVFRAQHYLRRYPFYVKIDIRAYFSSIDHDILKAALERRIKGSVLQLISAILDAGGVDLRGLPIGALTSQHFANFYLGHFDRFVLDQKEVGGYVRYMDDMVWFFGRRCEGDALLGLFEVYLREKLQLELKRSRASQIGRTCASWQGLSFCGFRIFAESLELSARRKLRYLQARGRWEKAHALGLIGPFELQAGYSAALEISAAAESRSFRSRDLARRPPPDV